MEENKGVLQRSFLNQFWLLIITLLVLILVWIIWRYLEIKYEEQEKIRIELQKAEDKKQAEIRSKKELKKYIDNLDVYTDNSLTKFVNNTVHYNDIWYIPENLVSVWWKHVIDWKGWYIKVSKLMKKDLNDLAKQFYLDTDNNIVVVSWYRSYKYQKWIKDRWCSDLFCSKAGFSEHQSGLAVDFWEATNKERYEKDEKLKKYFEWMKIHWVKNWFTNTYQKWLKVDWYTIEPWHWRYVWKELAEYLNNNKITFAEFYYKNVRK